MSGSNKKKRSWIIDLILILLIIRLGYFVYTMIWGDWTGLIGRLGYEGNPNIFDGVVGSVGAIGRGLNDMFGSVRP